MPYICMSNADPCLVVSLAKGQSLSHFPRAWALTLTEGEGRIEAFAQK
jgi:hypothetical protein